jgi:hypothetical protein
MRHGVGIGSVHRPRKLFLAEEQADTIAPALAIIHATHALFRYLQTILQLFNNVVHPYLAMQPVFE